MGEAQRWWEDIKEVVRSGGTSADGSRHYDENKGSKETDDDDDYWLYEQEQRDNDSDEDD